MAWAVRVTHAWSLRGSPRGRVIAVTAGAVLAGLLLVLTRDANAGYLGGSQDKPERGNGLVVDVDESQVPLNPPRGYKRVTPGQLNSLTAHGRYVNIQARSLLACINAGAV